jgi:ketosteroid isomerase-like protein
MKKYLLFLLLFPATIASSQSKDERKVAAAVEQLNHALVAADSNTLRRLTADALSYGHSSGKVEDKQAFVANVVNGPLKLLSITTSDQSIKWSKHTAVVRHLFTAKATNNGVPTDLKIGVLQVWQKRKGAWKLLARQGFKV